MRLYGGCCRFFPRFKLILSIFILNRFKLFQVQFLIWIFDFLLGLDRNWVICFLVDTHQTYWFIFVYSLNIIILILFFCDISGRYLIY